MRFFFLCASSRVLFVCRKCLVSKYFFCFILARLSVCVSVRSFRHFLDMVADAESDGSENDNSPISMDSAFLRSTISEDDSCLVGVCSDMAADAESDVGVNDNLPISPDSSFLRLNKSEDDSCLLGVCSDGEDLLDVREDLLLPTACVGSDGEDLLDVREDLLLPTACVGSDGEDLLDVREDLLLPTAGVF